MLWPHIHKTTPCVSQLTNYGGASHPAGKGSTPRPWFQRYAESLTLSAPGTLHALHPDAGASSAAMHTLDSASQIDIVGGLLACNACALA